MTFLFLQLMLTASTVASSGFAVAIWIKKIAAQAWQFTILGTVVIKNLFFLTDIRELQHHVCP